MRDWFWGSWAQRTVLACWAIFFAYWLIAALRTKRTIERSDGWWRRLALIVLALMLLSRSRTAGALRHLSLVLWSPTMLSNVVGGGLVLCGLLLALRARAVLAGNWSALVAIKAEHELVQRGPYRFVRHPIYSAMLLMLLGAAVVDGRLTWFIFLAVAIAGLTIKARSEERLLTKHFPEAYPAYRRRTKAIIPFVL